MSQSSNTADQDLPLWFTIPVQVLIWIVATTLSLILRLVIIPLYYFFGETSVGVTLWSGSLFIVMLFYIGADQYLTAFGLFWAIFFWGFVGQALQAFWNWCDRKSKQ